MTRFVIEITQMDKQQKGIVPLVDNTSKLMINARFNNPHLLKKAIPRALIALERQRKQDKDKEL